MPSFVHRAAKTREQRVCSHRFPPALHRHQDQRLKRLAPHPFLRMDCHLRDFARPKHVGVDEAPLGDHDLLRHGGRCGRVGHFYCNVDVDAARRRGDGDRAHGHTQLLRDLMSKIGPL